MAKNQKKPLSQNEQTSLIKYKATDLELDFPKSDKLTDDEQFRINKAVREHGIVTPDYRTAVNNKGIKTLLATDQKGVNILYNNLDNEDKFENGNDKYIRTPAIKKELCERQENLHPSITKAKLEHADKALDALSKNSKVEELRQIEKSRNDKQLPKVKKQYIKDVESRDELTGEQIKKGDVHHKERVADNPRKQNDKKNFLFTAPNNHDEIHSNNAESENDLERLAKKKGWNIPE